MGQTYLSPKGLSVFTLPPAIMAMLTPVAPEFSRPSRVHPVQGVVTEHGRIIGLMLLVVGMDGYSRLSPLWSR
jgi:hypothetical protein